MKLVNSMARCVFLYYCVFRFSILISVSVSVSNSLLVFGFKTRISFSRQVHYNALGMFIMFYYVYYVVDVVCTGLCRAHLGAVAGHCV